MILKKTNIPQRVSYQSWQELESYWVNGLVERISFIKHPFENPIFVHPERLPFPEEKFTSQVLIHRINSLELLDIPKDTHDLILFSPFLQWTQDVPGMLLQAHHALKERGFFVACFFGQDTLIEFKAICAKLDLDYTQGLQQRFLPTIHTKDAGMLMQRAGFASPIADIEHLSFSVPSVENLVEKLRDSGMTNSKSNPYMPYIPTTTLPRTFLSNINHLYLTEYPHRTDGINITVDLIFICGWKRSTLNAVTR